jgi:hypothetical protein
MRARLEIVFLNMGEKEACGKAVRLASTRKVSKMPPSKVKIRT